MDYLFLSIAASGFAAGAIAMWPYHRYAMARARRNHASDLRRLNIAWQARTAHWFAQRAEKEAA